MENKNITVSYFQNLKSQNNTRIKLELVFKDIKEGKWKNEIEQMRLAKVSNRDNEYSKLKMKLQCFTPSATFNDKRDKNFVLSYTVIISLDYDGIQSNEIDDIKNIICDDPNTFGCFICPF